MTDYTRYDYNQLVQRMTELLRDKPGWGNAYESSTGQELIQLMADSVDYLHYMLERRSQEMYIDTARLPSSIIARASEVGYRPRRRIGARGTVSIKLLDEEGNPKPALGTVSIPEMTSLFFDGIEFVTLNDVEIPVGQSETTVQIVQGTMVDFTFDPEDTEGDLNRFGFVTITDFTQYDNNYLRVFDGVKEYVDVAFGDENLAAIGAISFAAVGEPYYDIRYPAFGMRVIFGDEVSGVIPDEPVNVRLISTLGAEVAIQTTVDFELDSETLGDDIAITPANEYFYEIQNTTPIIGGSSPESIESIRTNATGFIRTNNRAVSREDFRYWVRQSGIGNIVDVEAFGEQEISTLVFNANNVFISYLTSSGSNLSQEHVAALREYLQRLSVVGTHIIIKPVNVVKIAYEIDFRRAPSLPISDSELHDIIRRKMASIFELASGSIGKEFQQSDIIDEFYRERVVRNGITYPVVDFLKIQLNGLYPIELPALSNIARISIPLSAVIVDGEEFIVIVDGQEFKVIADDDTPTSIIGKMRDKIYMSTAYTVRLESSEMTITSVDRGKTFTVDVSTGDLSDRVVNQFVVVIPPRTFDNPSNFPLFLAGSFSIIDEDGNVLFLDDGNGNLVDQVGSAENGTVDYVTGEVGVPVLSPGLHYIKFKQDVFDNFKANDESAFSVIDAKTDYLSSDETLSVIRLV